MERVDAAVAAFGCVGDEHAYVLRREVGDLAVYDCRTCGHTDTRWSA
jgi:hypothetical protein